MTVVDALPITAVGKPNKLPLRADATRRAVLDALAGIPGVQTVDCNADDGTVRAIITVANGDVDRVRKAMSQFTIDFEVNGV